MEKKTYRKHMKTQKKIIQKHTKHKEHRQHHETKHMETIKNIQNIQKTYKIDIWENSGKHIEPKYNGKHNIRKIPKNCLPESCCRNCYYRSSSSPVVSI